MKVVTGARDSLSTGISFSPNGCQKKKRKKIE
jgi:hypothetical protein